MQEVSTSNTSIMFRRERESQCSNTITSTPSTPTRSNKSNHRSEEKLIISSSSASSNISTPRNRVSSSSSSIPKKSLNESKLPLLKENNKRHQSATSAISSSCNKRTATATIIKSKMKSYIKAVRANILYELALLVSMIPLLIPKIIVLSWGAMYVFRNIAYMRHVPSSTRLPDIGFEYIKEVDNDYYSELLLYLNGSITFLFVSLPIIIPSLRGHAHGIYSIDIYNKILNMHCIGHVLRFITFISTSLPGPAKHCLPDAPLLRNAHAHAHFHNHADAHSNYYHWTLHEVLTRRSRVHVDPNCGDLIFSGHMFQDTSFTIIVLSYIYYLLPHHNNNYPNMHPIRIIIQILSIILVLTVLLQPYFIIAARNHYTVDVVVASYVAPMLWWTLEGYFYTTSFYTTIISKNIWWRYMNKRYLQSYIIKNHPCVFDHSYMMKHLATRSSTSVVILTSCDDYDDNHDNNENEDDVFKQHCSMDDIKLSSSLNEFTSYP